MQAGKTDALIEEALAGSERRGAHRKSAPRPASEPAGSAKPRPQPRRPHPSQLPPPARGRHRAPALARTAARRLLELGMHIHRRRGGALADDRRRNGELQFVTPEEFSLSHEREGHSEGRAADCRQADAGQDHSSASRKRPRRRSGHRNRSRTMSPSARWRIPKCSAFRSCSRTRRSAPCEI